MYTFFFFFKQKTAYEMRISAWISDVSLPIYESNLYRGGTGGRKAVPAPAALAKRTVDAHARTGGNLTDHDPTRRNLDLRPESCCERSEERRVGTGGVST